jgi:hypothetical protein
MILTLCAWCGYRWKHGDIWTRDTPREIRDLPEGEKEVKISHGICDICLDQLQHSET